MTNKRSMRSLWVLLVGLFFFSSLAYPGVDHQSLTPSEETEKHVNVILEDFSLRLNKAQVKAGWLTVTAENLGMSTHEIVILRTDLSPADLPRKEAKDHKGIVTGSIVNEEESTVETIAEIEEFPSGTSQNKKIFLEPGHYMLICNISGHYDKGMYTSLHVVQ